MRRKRNTRGHVKGIGQYGDELSDEEKKKLRKKKKRERQRRKKNR